MLKAIKNYISGLYISNIILKLIIFIIYYFDFNFKID